MKIPKRIRQLFFISTGILLYSCEILSNLPSETIKKSCKLKERLNDTVIVEGIFSTCIEYKSFHTIKKDKCYDDLQMDLNLMNPTLNDSIVESIYGMFACNASRRLVLKGILKMEKEGYGHLGDNNSEFVVTEIIDYDEIKLK